MRILFVCLGNICRSPLAEGLFRESLRRRGLTAHYVCESRGTSQGHSGRCADPRTMQNANKHNLCLRTHRATQITRTDCLDFDLLVAMDRSNLRNMTALSPEHTSKMVLFRDWDPDDTEKDVPDPYYGHGDGFEHVYQIVSRTVEVLLDQLEEQRQSK